MHLSEYYKMRELEDKHWWYRATHQAVLSELKVFPPDIKILDIGCGTGGLMERLIKDKRIVCGMDISKLALELASSRGLIKESIYQGSIEHIPFEDTQFDVAICLDVLCQQQIKTPESALKEVHRILKRKGLLILQVPAFEYLRGQHDFFSEIAHRFTKKELEKILAESGFIEISVWYRNVWLFPLLFFWRNISNRKKSDLAVFPDFLNELLYRYNLFDNYIAKRIPFLFGSSLFSIARKA